MTKYHVFEATDLSGDERRKAINFAIRIARNTEICKEATLGQERVALRLYSCPDQELSDRLSALGFREKC